MSNTPSPFIRKQFVSLRIVNCYVLPALSSAMVCASVVKTKSANGKSNLYDKKQDMGAIN
ncbi:hypothetical protein K445DRAFT_320451, partial [Daldinia sp. EC12]